MSIETPPVSAPPPPPPVPKKGPNIWAWLAVGCGVVMILGVGTCFGVAWYVQRKANAIAEDIEKNPARAAAEFAVRVNPDVELVSSTDDTITVRDKKTGEVVTVDFADAKEGKFTFRTKDGEGTIDADADQSGEGGTLKVTGPGGESAVFSAGASAAKVPEWVPVFTDGTVAGNYDARAAEGHSGAVTITTSASVATVMAFYKEKLEAAGFQVQTMTMDGTVAGGTVTGTTTVPNRTVNVVVSVADGKTQAMVTFSESRP